MVEKICGKGEFWAWNECSLSLSSAMVVSRQQLRSVLLFWLIHVCRTCRCHSSMWKFTVKFIHMAYISWLEWQTYVRINYNFLTAVYRLLRLTHCTRLTVNLLWKSQIFRLDALALSVIATATWLGGCRVAGWLAGCHTPVLYQNR